MGLVWGSPEGGWLVAVRYPWHIAQMGYPTTPLTSKQRRGAMKRAKRAERQAQRLAPKACVLCGSLIHAGQMLDHKWREHGERQVVESPAQPHKAVWVSVYSGGLPSLGTRSK